MNVQINNNPVQNWEVENVINWAKKEKLDDAILNFILCEQINGKCLLILNEIDLHENRDKCKHCNLKLGHVKNFWLSIRNLQRVNHESLIYLGFHGTENVSSYNQHYNHNHQNSTNSFNNHHNHGFAGDHFGEMDRISPPLSETDGRCGNPEFFKTMISLGYAFLVTWITAFVMVVVHERVPDMKKYPPLPDIFLDNVPHIPFAFQLCELFGTILFAIWLCVLTLHRHRMVLLRRFFALGGTVFLLRCVTMLITSLSVPGTHIQCTAHDYEIDDENMEWFEAVLLRVSRAYTIWSGLGMSIQGVRTCGDYMFSGHTVALTTLNFFITEYTPRHFYFVHTSTWLLNIFGVFFILAAHEHYSIDVFVAFYITSRLFLYYHTLANNQALMSRDSNRTRIWFPMFSYFESSVDGIIPNEYDTIDDVFHKLFSYLLNLKDLFMLTARRFWIANNFNPIVENKKNKTGGGTPTSTGATVNTPTSIIKTTNLISNDNKNNLNNQINLSNKKLSENMLNLVLNSENFNNVVKQDLLLSSSSAPTSPTTPKSNINLPIISKKDN